MTISTGEKIFHMINTMILIIISAIAIYPLVYVLSASLSSGDAVTTGSVFLWPKEFTLTSYEKVLSQQGIWLAYGNTFFYTIVGTLVNLIFTICGAYPLSRKRMLGRKVFSFLVVFTMWFQAGIIPFYLTIKDYGLVNTRFAIIFGFACATFNVILLKSFFESFPDSLEEAATIDGANDLQILFRIILPLSKPALATVGLFYAVSRWNGYFWTMVLLQDDSKIPLQVLLKKLIVDMTTSDEFSQAVNVAGRYSKETIIYATIIIAVIPMIIIYPYIQKYFVKGTMLGAVKG